MFPNSFIAKLMSTFGILNKTKYTCELHFQCAVGSLKKYLFIPLHAGTLLGTGVQAAHPLLLSSGSSPSVGGTSPGIRAARAAFSVPAKHGLGIVLKRGP